VQPAFHVESGQAKGELPSRHVTVRQGGYTVLAERSGYLFEAASTGKNHYEGGCLVGDADGLQAVCLGVRQEAGLAHHRYVVRSAIERVEPLRLRPVLLERVLPFREEVDGVD
jgi:hypothetical protein